MPPAQSLSGMTDLQAELQAAADEMVASDAETGLQIAVRQRGYVVADVVSGVADPRTGAEVRPARVRRRRDAGVEATARGHDGHRLHRDG
jgi:hypothetical protein